MTHRLSAVLRAVQPKEMRDRAHNVFTLAKRKRLIDPATTCQDCGAVGPTHGHHADYSQPLAVEWLCRRCHTMRHAGPNSVRLRRIRQNDTRCLSNSQTYPLTLSDDQFASVLGVSMAELDVRLALGLIPEDHLLSPIPGRWSLVKVRAWLAEGQPAVRRRRSRESAA